MNTTTAISICSNALVLLGHDTISSFEEEGIGAKVANNFYETTYRAKLVDYEWDFASRKVLLTKLTAEPLNTWKYAYQIPSNHLRTITTYPHSDYEIFEDKIFSNNDNLQLDYIYRVDESFLPPAYRESLELYLASKWAIPVTENATNAGIYLDMYEKQTRKAKSIDSMSKPNRGATDVAALPLAMRTRGRGGRR